MSENNLEGEQREQCKEAKFVDDKRAELIQRVTAVMPIADELKCKDMLHGEKYDEIRAKETDQDKMRTLFESFKSGNAVKIAFYELLEKHELPLFKELGGVCRKRKLADPESPVPCKRLNTGSSEQDNLNFNNASTSAQTPAQTITTVYNIVNERPPSYNMENIQNSIVPKTEWRPVKPPAPKKEKNSPASKVKKPPAPKKEKNPLAPKKEKKPPVKKPPTPKKEKKPPVLKVKKPPAPKKNKPPVPKVKKPPTPKKEKKPPVPKIKKPPVPKVKKSPAPKKNKPPVPKIKKPPVPKVKKPLAPKKVKKSAGRK